MEIIAVDLNRGYVPFHLATVYWLVFRECSFVAFRYRQSLKGKDGSPTAPA